MRVALIEDEDFLRELYKREFEAAGFSLDGFATGEDGLVALKQNQYDVILLDIMLPGINGLQVLKQIKQDGATKGIPVILLTNLGQDEVIKEGFTLGAEGYLIKAAYSTKQVVEEMKNILKGKTPQPNIQS